MAVGIRSEECGILCTSAVVHAVAESSFSTGFGEGCQHRFPAVTSVLSKGFPESFWQP